MNTYEGMFIINPQLSDEDTEKVIETIQEEIKKSKGEIANIERIGKQHLSYPIKKFQDGYYLLLSFQGEGDFISKIKAKYKINNNILRILILKKRGPTRTGARTNAEESPRKSAL